MSFFAATRWVGCVILVMVAPDVSLAGAADIEIATAPGEEANRGLRVYGFEDSVLGQMPVGWRPGFSGEGKADWRVVEDGGNRVLAQTRADNPNRHFNVVWNEGLEVRDVDLSVRWRAVSGRHDQGGGLVWRLKDERNYYVVRVNPLENNVVLYKMEDGVRTDLELVGEGQTYGKKLGDLEPGWHTLGVKVAGDLFSVILDGAALFQVSDATFSGSGHVGLWTKADAVTWFDDLRVVSASAAGAGSGARPPNFVIVFLDDSGWADFSPFAKVPYPTPNVQRLADEGCCFDNFYVPQAICSASRAALMTGCYPGRTKVFGAHPPRARGLDPKFATLAEVLKRRGYATGVFGKWHLGDVPETRPPARGFDESCGLMYSNDMWEFHPENPEYWGQWPLQFWDNGRVTIERVTAEEQPQLTTWYTEHAVDFIQRHRAEPFFLYVPHSMPHVPLFCSDKFRGKSGAGLYGDVMMELDWSVGEILRALADAGVADDTMVLFTSDNGPWISYGNHAGQTPFREAKGTGFDGGIRSACIVRFPGRIASGTRSARTWSSVDVLPTFAALAGAGLPELPIDGKDVWAWLTDPGESSPPHDYYPFSTGGTFEGVVSGDGHWKLHVPHAYRTLVTGGRDGAAGQYRQEQIGLSLFDLVGDPWESRNVIDEHPDVAARLRALAARHQERFYGPATGE